MSDFYLTLPSDSSLDIFKLNRHNHFNVQLPSVIDLNSRQWEVALAEIILPSRIYNISSEETNIEIMTTDSRLASNVDQLLNNGLFKTTVGTLSGKKNWIYSVNIDSGFYASSKQLVKSIHEKIKFLFTTAFKMANSDILIDYSKSSRNINIQTTGTLSIRFNPNLFQKLGGDLALTGLFHTTSNGIFTHGVDLNMGYNHIYIYSNIVDYSIVGNIKSRLLRTIPFKTVETKEIDNGSLHKHIEFIHMNYIKIQTTLLDVVEITICGDTGQPVPFAGGKSLVKLHFRYI